MSEPTKICTLCGKEKPLEEFLKNKRISTGRDARCKACHNEWSKKYVCEHPEQRKETDRKYSESHRDVIMDYREKHRQDACNRTRKWAQANPDRKKEMDKEYREANYSRLLHRSREYYKNNSLRMREYRIKNRERRKIVQMQRHARQMNAPGNGLSDEQWENIKASYHFRCAYCGGKEKLTVDHIVPLISGGAHDEENVVPSCQQCNSSKQVKSLLMFLYKRKATPNAFTSRSAFPCK